MLVKDILNLLPHDTYEIETTVESVLGKESIVKCVSRSTLQNYSHLEVTRIQIGSKNPVTDWRMIRISVCSKPPQTKINLHQ